MYYLSHCVQQKIDRLPLNENKEETTMDVSREQLAEQQLQQMMGQLKDANGNPIVLQEVALPGVKPSEIDKNQIK